MRNDSAYYSDIEIESISNSLSVVDYFMHLEMRGDIRFERKSGNEYYFRTDCNKFSVSENGYYDFKTAEGGKILKAVMEFEKVDWKDAVEFVKNFNPGLMLPGDYVADQQANPVTSKSTLNEIVVTKVIVPNNDNLLTYFAGRGISERVLVDYTKQIHYQIADKNYFGIGIENISGGFDIRNRLMKSKVGKNNMSEIIGEKNEMIVFEGMTDMLSFAQLLRNNNLKNTRTLITLNSVTNVERFLTRYSDYNGKIFLCLDGDQAGNDTTVKVLKTFNNSNVKDIRSLYNISENGDNDLNEYLQNTLRIQNKHLELRTDACVLKKSLKQNDRGQELGTVSGSKR